MVKISRASQPKRSIVLCKSIPRIKRRWTSPAVQPFKRAITKRLLVTGKICSSSYRRVRKSCERFRIRSQRLKSWLAAKVRGKLLAVPKIRKREVIYGREKIDRLPRLSEREWLYA